MKGLTYPTVVLILALLAAATVAVILTTSGGACAASKTPKPTATSSKPTKPVRVDIDLDCD